MYHSHGIINLYLGITTSLGSPILVVPLIYQSKSTYQLPLQLNIMTKHVKHYFVTFILFYFDVVGPIFYRIDYLLTESRISAGQGGGVNGGRGRALTLFQVQNYTSLYPIANKLCKHNN